MSKEWIGKIRVYLYLRRIHREFCWISLWKDGSLLFGFSPEMHFTKYGSAIGRSGYFTEHIKTLTRGDISINDAKYPHVSLHPPIGVKHMSGIAQMRDGTHYIDRWELDWFPVTRPIHLLSVKTGDMASLQAVSEFKRPYEIVSVPLNVQHMQMNLWAYPKSPILLHDPKSITKLIGGCPHYFVCCYFYTTITPA